MARKARASTKPQASGDDGDVGDDAIVIKKYANRRLYNTATSSYVTLDHLCQMVKDGQDFVVYDAKSGENITRSVLTQIIVEEEAKGQNLLPISFLRQLIGFYGDNLQAVVPQYLDYAMQAFSQNQDKTRDYMQEALGGLFPFANFDEMTQQNMAMMERTMEMFRPDLATNKTKTGSQADTSNTPPRPESAPESKPESTSEAPVDTSGIDLLRQQVEMLQRQLDAMSGKDNDKR
ncbi:MAG: polyhydroxyalkanoate synthesis repressor PhaR [Rhodospirillaceae bacterium]|nr:polyhydroxyalkanoate synthesis repressor PhaR [Rhodospirillaceae bacterium]